MRTLSLDAIAALGANVLCCDTCAILDIMRDPTRDAARANERRAALELLAALDAGTDLVAFVADQVRFEFSEHALSVEAEARRAISRLQMQLQRIDEINAVFGGTGTSYIGHLDDHVTRARTVVDRWIDAATPAIQSPEIASRALLRLNQVRTPAKRGKDSMKDCVIIETYLDIVGELRAAGLTSKVVFISSNTKDFAGETGSALKPDLASEFSAIAMEYAPNFAAAKHALGL